MNTCKTCGYSGIEFYKCSPGKCKECYKIRVREYRKENINRIKEYDRDRANLPHRINARSEYQKTDSGKIALRNGSRAWAERNPEKTSAVHAINNAVRDGKIFKKPCEICGEHKVQAHHYDYSRPLEVKWMCIYHHSQWHKMNRDKLRRSDN